MPLDAQLIRRLRRDSQAVQTSYERRDATIREAIDAGASYREVSALTGLSKSAIAKIANR